MIEGERLPDTVPTRAPPDAFQIRETYRDQSCHIVLDKRSYVAVSAYVVDSFDAYMMEYRKHCKGGLETVTFCFKLEPIPLPQESLGTVLRQSRRLPDRTPSNEYNPLEPFTRGEWLKTPCVSYDDPIGDPKSWTIEEHLDGLSALHYRRNVPMWPSLYVAGTYIVKSLYVIGTFGVGELDELIEYDRRTITCAGGSRPEKENNPAGKHFSEKKRFCLESSNAPQKHFLEEKHYYVDHENPVDLGTFVRWSNTLIYTQTWDVNGREIRNNYDPGKWHKIEFRVMADSLKLSVSEVL